MNIGTPKIKKNTLKTTDNIYLVFIFVIMKILIYLYFFPVFIFSQNFIQIEKDLVNIRFDADQNSEKVGQAEFGQIFLSNSSTKKWVQIEVPSGEKRWIYKKLTSQVKDYGAILDTVDIGSLKEALIKARKQAIVDARTKKIEFMSKKDVENILIDSYLLSVFRSWNVSPIHFPDVMAFRNDEKNVMFGQAYERLVRVSFIDYDIFEVLGEELIIETKRCFKIGQRMDAMIKIFYHKGIVKQELCFLDGYGKDFENCVLIKEFYNNITQSTSDQMVLTKDGKLKQVSLILQPTEPNFNNYKKIVSY